MPTEMGLALDPSVWPANGGASAIGLRAGSVRGRWSGVLRRSCDSRCSPTPDRVGSPGLLVARRGFLNCGRVVVALWGWIALGWLAGCGPAPVPKPAAERVEVSGVKAPVRKETPAGESAFGEAAARLGAAGEGLNGEGLTSVPDGSAPEGAMPVGRTRALTFTPSVEMATCFLRVVRAGVEGESTGRAAEEVAAVVAVDGQLARTESGELLRTPCELDLPVGEHRFVVAAKGYKEVLQTHAVAEGREIEIALAYEPFAEPAGLIASRYFTAEVGEELALHALNSGGAMADPFVTREGLSLWAGGDREEGKGVYVSRRASVWDEFGPPEFVSETRGATLAGSPSVTADESQVAWVVVGKQRIWGASLGESAGGGRAPRTPLKFTTMESERWLSAWLSPSGLSLYSLQVHDGKRRDYQAIRLAPDESFEDDWFSVELHRAHPVLSFDALRLYLFDGKTLKRAQRERDTDPFGEPEVVREFSLAHYYPRPDRRQFWVTEDEQWLYVSDDPERSGNLYVTRIAEEPKWVYVPRGRALKMRSVAMADPEAGTTPEGKPGEEPGEVAGPDPRSLPLAYEVYRKELAGLLEEWKFAEARALVESAESRPELARERELVGWDREEVLAANRFWEELGAVLGKMEPGAKLRLAGAQAEFVKYDEGRLEVTVRGKAVTRVVTAISPVDLIGVVEAGREVQDDEEWAFAVAAFLAAAPGRSSPAILNSRIQKAGVAGRRLVDRSRQRDLALVRREIERGNLGPALVRIDALVAKAPQSESATAALEMKSTLYSRQEWRPVGGQTWDTSVAGQFTTGESKAAEAWLSCGDRFTNFQVSLEWKSVGPAAQGGVYFGYDGSGPVREKAYKLHVANDKSLAANPDRFSTGALLGIAAPRVNAVNAEGEWNSLVARVVGGKVTVTVNGEVVLKDQALEGEGETKTGAVKTGLVLIDGEFPGISYRKVLVYELPGGK